MTRGLMLVLMAALAAEAQGPGNVLVVVNTASPVSVEIGQYYVQRRHIPPKNICRLKTTSQEEISRDVYEREVARPIAHYLRAQNLRDRILYIVTTLGVPLKIAGTEYLKGTEAAVDSELCLLYGDMQGKPHPLEGFVPNPFYRQIEAPFAHPNFPMYLVTRLAAYDINDVRKMIDRALEARNRGRFVLDAKSGTDEPGDDWLRDAAILLPAGRTVFDETPNVLYGQRDVIGYASWGSNDPNRNRRWLGFQWLPGAILTEYVSTNGRTFARPPDRWIPSKDWKDRSRRFADSPQTVAADYIHEGAAGVAANVYEPYLQMIARPDVLLPAYYSGRNLAESYYLSIPGLSWQNIVLGDPLCAIGPPH